MSNETMICASCGLTVLIKGVHSQWKGIPMKPNSAEIEWYCREKELCEEAFRQAVKKAERAWSGNDETEH